VAQFASQCFAGGFQLASDAADTARPGIAAKRVNHCSSNAPLSECFEFDAAGLVEPMGGVD
jgi:hypothetical protein